MAASMLHATIFRKVQSAGFLHGRAVVIRVKLAHFDALV